MTGTEEMSSAERRVMRALGGDDATGQVRKILLRTLRNTYGLRSPLLEPIAALDDDALILAAVDPHYRPRDTGDSPR